MTTWPDHLAARFGQTRPRKLLSLDGGGIRGVLTLEILASIERQVKETTGLDRLCDYFDYIGGTSTGAIIAAGLSMGMSTRELLEFYEAFGRQMFEPVSLLERCMNGWSSLYDDEPLGRKLKEVFHKEGAPSDAADLTSNRLRCLLLVVTRNLTTDSPWPISSNPFAKYNDLSRPDCNLRIPIWKLVRASTAAPFYFPPETLAWDPTDHRKTFVFVDGGVTPYNNPGFLLFRMATHPAYGLNWKATERDLLLISVGTGADPRPTPGSGRTFIQNAQGFPHDLLYGVQVDQDINCRMFGRCVHGAEIDRELGNLVLPMASEDRGGQSSQRSFRYVRYNADLSQPGLKALGLGDIDSTKVRDLVSVNQIPELCRIGAAVAEREVRVKEHFGPFLSTQ